MRLDDDVPEPVERWLLKEFRSGGSNEHLRACPDAYTTKTEGSDGTYGCDTGCEYARLETVVTCPHGEVEEFTYGEFGELADILKEILDGA